LYSTYIEFVDTYNVDINFAEYYSNISAFQNNGKQIIWVKPKQLTK